MFRDLDAAGLLLARGNGAGITVIWAVGGFIAFDATLVAVATAIAATIDARLFRGKSAHQDPIDLLALIPGAFLAVFTVCGVQAFAAKKTGRVSFAASGRKRGLGQNHEPSLSKRALLSEIF